MLLGPSQIVADDVSRMSATPVDRIFHPRHAGDVVAERGPAGNLVRHVRVVVDLADRRHVLGPATRDLDEVFSAIVRHLLAGLAAELAETTARVRPVGRRGGRAR